MDMEMSNPCFASTEIWLFSWWLWSQLPIIQRNYRKNHNKMKEFQKLSTYNYLWHFAFILHFISLFSNIVCFTNLVYCSHTWPLWVNFFSYTVCITMELKFMLYSMLLDIVYYKITIGQNHNVHFIERRRTNSIILEY